FWGQVSTDKRLKRINSWVHREYLRLFERCLIQCWPECSQWSPAKREQVLRSLVTFINGLTASAVANERDWPAARQIEQLRLQVHLLRAWAKGAGGASIAARGDDQPQRGERVEGMRRRHAHRQSQLARPPQGKAVREAPLGGNFRRSQLPEVLQQAREQHRHELDAHVGGQAREL